MALLHRSYIPHARNARQIQLRAAIHKRSEAFGPGATLLALMPVAAC